MELSHVILSLKVSPKSHNSPFPIGAHLLPVLSTPTGHHLIDDLIDGVSISAVSNGCITCLLILSSRLFFPCFNMSNSFCLTDNALSLNSRALFFVFNSTDFCLNFSFKSFI